MFVIDSELSSPGSKTPIEVLLGKVPKIADIGIFCHF